MMKMIVSRGGWEVYDEGREGGYLFVHWSP